MDRIRVLSEDVANKIAAGEVVERPASVIRELLDNSLDAGADRINIKIDEGGKKIIRINDNGLGMNRDDLLLSIERHATSKILSEEDLFSIKTLGFRGEALPSIASVSRMTITSRLKDDLIAYRLVIDGGQLKSIDEAGSPVGTSVEVRDLFFNVPARRKFLRAVKTETNHIVDALSRIVLPYSNIQLRLDSSGRTLLNLPASENELNRLSILFGRDVASSMIETFLETDGLSVKAFLAPPDINRARGDLIYTYVNKRSIRDRLVTRAIIDGYGQRLMKGRYPQAVVFMEIDPSLVDVNVHPTKQEVRFHQSRLVFQTLVATIGGAFKDHFQSLSDINSIRSDAFPIIRPGHSAVSEPEWEYSDSRDHLSGKTEIPTARNTPPVRAAQESYKDFFLHDHPSQAFIREAPEVIGQLKDTYILCQTFDGLFIVDQHAAHERIVYETLKKSFESSKIEVQPFLIPQRLELSTKESRVVLKNFDQLIELGFELDHFGGNTFLLRSLPSILSDVKWDNCLLDLIPVFGEGSNVSKDSMLDNMLTVMACHGSIRAGQKMSHIEMTRLLEQLEQIDLFTNCPHGRPVFRKFSFFEIEKMFKRVI